MAPLESLIQTLQQHNAKQVVVLTDSIVNTLYPHYLDRFAEHFATDKIVVPAGEASKSIEQAIGIWQRLLRKSYGQDLFLVNFGGGMVCDLGGFVAATYKRGIHCINYPTTLLAMTDAAIGGKNAVNMGGVKNCIGTIRQPDYVVPADTHLLKTLPPKELQSGFGEMIKYALTSSAAMFIEFEKLEKISATAIRPEWIETCAAIKREIVAIDPMDRQQRHVLNFGHTFGHALESLWHAEGKQMPHGVAVAIGTVYESSISMAQGLLKKEEDARIRQLVTRHYQIPPLTVRQLAQIKSYMKQDKKNRKAGINFTLLRHIGEAVTDCIIPETDLFV